MKSLRDQISFVLQDSLLFSGTIWDNISYGRPDADPDETIRAAQLANAHDFIMNLPHGYGSVVSERGTTLSGGQRRRIAIARAIVRNTPILILDEPTTGLDVASEHTVVDALEHLMKGRTSLVIAHRLETIRRADAIFVVKDAAIVERGTHDSLLAAGGVYRELFELQTIGQPASRRNRPSLSAGSHADVEEEESIFVPKRSADRVCCADGQRGAGSHFQCPIETR